MTLDPIDLDDELARRISAGVAAAVTAAIGPLQLAVEQLTDRVIVLEGDDTPDPEPDPEPEPGTTNVWLDPGSPTSWPYQRIPTGVPLLPENDPATAAVRADRTVSLNRDNGWAIPINRATRNDPMVRVRNTRTGWTGQMRFPRAGLIGSGNIEFGGTLKGDRHFVAVVDDVTLPDHGTVYEAWLAEWVGAELTVGHQGVWPPNTTWRPAGDSTTNPPQPFPSHVGMQASKVSALLGVLRPEHFERGRVGTFVTLVMGNGQLGRFTVPPANQMDSGTGAGNVGPVGYGETLVAPGLTLDGITDRDERTVLAALIEHGARVLDRTGGNDASKPMTKTIARMDPRCSAAQEAAAERALGRFIARARVVRRDSTIWTAPLPGPQPTDTIATWEQLAAAADRDGTSYLVDDVELRERLIVRAGATITSAPDVVRPLLTTSLLPATLGEAVMLLGTLDRVELIGDSNAVRRGLVQLQGTSAVLRAARLVRGGGNCLSVFGGDDDVVLDGVAIESYYGYAVYGQGPMRGVVAVGQRLPGMSGAEWVSNFAWHGYGSPQGRQQLALAVAGAGMILLATAAPGLTAVVDVDNPGSVRTSACTAGYSERTDAQQLDLTVRSSGFENAVELRHTWAAMRLDARGTRDAVVSWTTSRIPAGATITNDPTPVDDAVVHEHSGGAFVCLWRDAPMPDEWQQTGVIATGPNLSIVDAVRR